MTTPAHPSPHPFLPADACTVASLRKELSDGIRALDFCLVGRDFLPASLLEAAAATAESCRLQVRRWLGDETPLDDGQRLSSSLFHVWVLEALDQIRADVGLEAFLEGCYREASELFEARILDQEAAPLTLSSAIGCFPQPTTLKVTA